VAVLLVVLLLELGDGPSAAVPPEPESTTAPSTFDSFSPDGPGGPDGLGRADSGPRWEEVSGSWGIIGGRAAVASPASGQNVAVIETGSTDGTLQVSIPSMAAGAGAVFRYRDEGNRWQVTSSTRYSTWVLEHVVDGEVAVREDVGLATVEDGTAIAVVFEGEDVVLYVDGVALLTASDGRPTAGSAVGLVVTEGEPGRARFDDLSFFTARDGT